MKWKERLSKFFGTARRKEEQEEAKRMERRLRKITGLERELREIDRQMRLFAILGDGEHTNHIWETSLMELLTERQDKLKQLNSLRQEYEDMS